MFVGKQNVKYANSEQVPIYSLAFGRGADFKLLKQALANFRVKLIVHDNMSLDEIKALQAKTKEDIIAAQAAIHAAYIDNTSPDTRLSLNMTVAATPPS